MITPIHREELLELCKGDVQLVDVLPTGEYREEHLPGAINIPLTKLDADAVSALDRGRPVVVYCHDDT